MVIPAKTSRDAVLTAQGDRAVCDYVEAIPAICDINHGLHGPRAVTIHCLTVPHQATDCAWPKRQGLR